MFALINNRNAINSRLLLCFAQSDGTFDSHFLKLTGKPSQQSGKVSGGKNCKAALYCQGKHSQPDRMGCSGCYALLKKRLDKEISEVFSISVIIQTDPAETRGCFVQEMS